MQSVTIPNDYFLNMSKKDYTNYAQALIREFIQNSYDAKAKQIVLDFDSEEKSLTVFDDGHGMTKDIILNKLLVLGESYKNNDNATGAFGHAKLLLYFSWKKWEIESLNNKVIGESHYYEIQDNNDYVNGTISKIYFDNSEDFDNVYVMVRSYLYYCELDCNIFIYYNGELKFDYNDKYSFKVTKKNLIYEDENIRVYDSNTDGYYMLIRQNGLSMFKSYLSKNDTVPIIEIKGSPYEMLLQNRDYFKKPYDEILNKLNNIFSTDSIKTFAKHNEIPSEDEYNFDIKTFLNKKNIFLENIAFYKCTKEDVEKILKTKRAKRILTIAKKFLDIFEKEYNLKISIGFMNNNREDFGLAQVKDDNKYYIYINYSKITKYIPNYRQTAIFLYHVLVHEYAHILTHSKYKSLTHDENFSLSMMEIYDRFWNITTFVKIFRETWKKI